MNYKEQQDLLFQEIEEKELIQKQDHDTLIEDVLFVRSAIGKPVTVEEANRLVEKINELA